MDNAQLGRPTDADTDVTKLRAAALTGCITNAMTVDVEDYFQVSA